MKALRRFAIHEAAEKLVVCTAGRVAASGAAPLKTAPHTDALPAAGEARMRAPAWSERQPPNPKAFAKP